MKGEQLFKHIISGQMGGSLGDALRGGLEKASKVYERVIEYRNERYNHPKHVQRVAVPVISIGNITVGGTGKTPMVRYVCETLDTAHHNVSVLSRGYKADNNKKPIVVSRQGTVDVSSFISGDEAWLLAKTLPNANVIIGSKRVESAKIAVDELQSDVLVLDDGFQHRALGREADIVLIDASHPFGYGAVLPRGLLREPLENLKRATYIVLTKTNQIDPEQLKILREDIHALAPLVPVAETIHQTVGFQTMEEWSHNGSIHGISDYDGTPLLAISGIGQPSSFISNLKSYGFTVQDMMSFGDHHDYSEEDVVKLWERCFKTGIQGIITTEKDAVKLSQVRAIRDLQIPVYVLVIGIALTKGEEDFKSYVLQIAKGK